MNKTERFGFGTFGRLFGFTLLLFLPCFFISPVSGIAKESTLTITTSDDILPISVIPSPGGTFAKSANNTVTVSTDNYSGYNLSISSSGSQSAVSADEDEVVTLPSGTSIDEATFSAGSIYNNMLGYKPSQYVSSSGGTNTVVQNTNYLSLPSLGGDLLAITSSANATGTSDTYTLGFATRIDTTMPAGTYTYTYVLVVVANDIVFNVTYEDNTTDTVTNMPVPNPQSTTIDGGTPAAESYVTLSDAVPVRNGKRFAGWCDTATTVDSTTGDDVCPGNLYQAEDDLPVDQTAGPNITLNATWVDTLFPIVFNQIGACEFHGNTPSNITGSECEDYWDSMFIDTKIPLYSQQNILKDFEIHFTIDSYNPSTQVDNDNQQTFVNDKVSSTASSSTIASGEAPGLVVRRSGTSIEFSSKINDEQARPAVTASSIINGGGDVSIFRLDSKIYYSINNGPLVFVQDITGFDQYFGLTTWFGGYPADDCTGDNGLCTNAKRFIEATLSNMYIRLGESSDDDVHTINFKANDGTTTIVDTYLIKDGGAVTTLPAAPVYSDHLFQGWFTAVSGGTEVTVATVPIASTDYYAQWLATVAIADIDNPVIALTPNDTETIIVNNASELEPYTFTSSNTNVATVNSTTGEITAVGPGSAIITMTGTTSGTTKTISVSVSGQVYHVSFDSQGGVPSTYLWDVGENSSFSSLPLPTRTDYRLIGWFTGPNGTGTELTTSTVFTSLTPTQYYAYWEAASYVCKIATSLHTESCNQTSSNGCKGAGYGSGAPIEYGSLVQSSTMTPGDAYNCDINNDGLFDDATERFYYFGTENGNAKFVYFQSMAITNSTYDVSLSLLPVPSDPGWDNPNLVTFSGDYNGSVGRFMTYPEAHALCDNSDTDIGKNGRCLYLLEKSAFANPEITDGIWLEKQPNNANRIQTRSRGITHTNPQGTTANASRPSIEVPVQYVEPYVEPVVTNAITFDPQNENESNPIVVHIPVNDQLGSNIPSAPSYTNHIFLNWYTAPSGGTVVTPSIVPTGETTYYAQWIGTVALAQVANSNISVIEGGTNTFQVTNTSDIESFTCSSSDSTIASVDSSTCVISGVSEGTATISITGVTSGTTKSNLVTVTVLDPSSVFRVTFDPQNGDNTFYRDIPVGDSIGSFMPQDPTYTNHVFIRWYDISNDNTVTSATEPSGDMTVYAEWKLDVTQAIIANTDLTVPEDGSITIVVSNASSLESYTFSSEDTTIATVDPTTGVVTGVSEGTVNIIMTGTTSSLTKTLEVDVLPAPPTMWTVTFNSNGGSTPSPISSFQVEDGTAVGTLPTTSRPNHRFFGWYKDDGTFYEEVYPDEIIEDDVTFYARWVDDTSSFPIEFAEINECEFNGNAVISGTYCTQDKTKKFVDSGVALFSTANYSKDFEIGFTIVELAQPQSVSQGTLVNSKLEDSSKNYPGFVYRSVSTGPNYELTGRFSNGSPTTFTTAGTNLQRVKIVREGGVLKYSINDGSMVTWFNVNDNTHRFDTNVWFGAAPTSNGTSPQRYLKGKLTDMYIRLGTQSEYSIEFNPDGGYLPSADLSRTITIGDPVGTLPVPTPPSENYTFEAWYDESVSPAVAITSSTYPDGNKTYIAHYTYQSSNIPVVFDVSNKATRDYNTLINTWISSPINISTFNEATPINNSTWGDTSELPEAQFWTGLKNSFESNGCLVPSYKDTATTTPNPSSWLSGVLDCGKPDAYDTRIKSALVVRLDNNQGEIVTYADADNGVIHNMIPGQTYYWEKADDSTKYGYVSAVSNTNYSTRWVDTGKIRNVRDLGGLPVSYTDGNNQTVTGTLAYGRLFRGERLWDTPTSELTKLGINKEYDVGDISEYPNDTKLSAYQYDPVIHYNFDYNTGDENVSSSNYMKAWNAVTDIMLDITNSNDPKNIYFHCRIGSDRTGTVAYLLEGLLGVPDEARYQEYELTHLSGQWDRTRYYKLKTTSNNLKFVFMMGYVRTTADIYNWYMQNSNADANLIQSFRSAMTVQSNNGGGGNQSPTNSIQTGVSSYNGRVTSSDTSSSPNYSSGVIGGYDNLVNSYSEPLGVSESSMSSDSSSMNGLAIGVAVVAGASAAAFYGAGKYNSDKKE